LLEQEIETIIPEVTNVEFFSSTHLQFVYPNWNHFYLLKGPIFLLRDQPYNLVNGLNPLVFEKSYSNAWLNYLSDIRGEAVFPTINHILHSNWIIDIVDFPIERNVDFVVKKYTPPGYFEFEYDWTPPSTYNFRKWMCLNYHRMYYTGEEYIGY
jgi:hypothetical protein